MYLNFLFFSNCWQRAEALSTLEGYSGYGPEQGEKVCEHYNQTHYFVDEMLEILFK
jgi:hypothetical protein